MKRWLLILFLIPAVYSCKKDHNGPPPVITINTPGNATHYYYGDTISVVAMITDDEAVKSVKVGVLNANNIIALPSVTLTFDDDTVYLKLKIQVNNKKIVTGYHYLVIEAGDGESTASNSRQIYFHELGRQRLGVYVASSFAQSTKVEYISSTSSSFQTLATLSGDFCGMEVNSYFQQVYTAGLYTGNLYALHPTTGSIQWQVTNAATGGNPFFRDITFDDDVMIYARHDGFIKAVDQNQGTVLQFNVQPGYYPEKILKCGIYIMVVEKKITSSDRRMSSYLYATGAGFQSKPINTAAVELLTKNSSSIYVLRNENNRGIIEMYNISGNYFTTLYNFNTSENILCAARINENTLLVSTTAGIYKFDYNTWTAPPFLLNVKAQQIAYDDLYNEVFIAVNSHLTSCPLTSPVTTIANAYAADSIQQLRVLYNK